MNTMRVRHVLARQEEEGLAPGSVLAREAGCECDHSLNDHPVWHGGHGPAWWVSVECPIHPIAGITPTESAVRHLLIEDE